MDYVFERKMDSKARGSEQERERDSLGTTDIMCFVLEDEWY